MSTTQCKRGVFRSIELELGCIKIQGLQLLSIGPAQGGYIMVSRRYGCIIDNRCLARSPFLRGCSQYICKMVMSLVSVVGLLNLYCVDMYIILAQEIRL